MYYKGMFYKYEKCNKLEQTVGSLLLSGLEYYSKRNSMSSNKYYYTDIRKNVNLNLKEVDESICFLDRLKFF